MGSLFITPDWFFGYDITMEFIFAIVTMLVCYFAWKIAKVTGERNIKLFSLGFAFIALSYFAQSFLNLLILNKLDDEFTTLVSLQSIYHFYLFGTYLYAILFLIGLLLVAYIALRIYSLRTFVLLFLLTFTSLYFSPHKTFMLYLISTLLLGFIVYYYFTNYWNSKHVRTFLVLLAMVLLFVASISFMHSIIVDDANYYVIAHCLELTAYVLILVNLIIILRAGKQLATQKLNIQKLKKNGKKTR